MSSILSKKQKSSSISDSTDALQSWDSDAGSDVNGRTEEFSGSDASGTYYWINHYDANGNLTEWAYGDSNGYSSFNRYLTDTDADGNVIGYTCESFWSDPDGTYASTVRYDLRGNPTESTYIDNNGCSSTSRYQMDMDAEGNVIGYSCDTVWTDPTGTYGSTIRYDVGGELTESTYTDNLGYSSITRYHSDTDVEGNVVGRTVSITWIDPSGTYDSTARYDAGGNLTESTYTDHRGYSSTSRYHTDTDAEGNVIGYSCDTTWIDTNGAHGWTVRYDAAGNVIESICTAALDCDLREPEIAICLVNTVSDEVSAGEIDLIAPPVDDPYASASGTEVVLTGVIDELQPEIMVI